MWRVFSVGGMLGECQARVTSVGMGEGKERRGNVRGG